MKSTELKRNIRFSEKTMNPIFQDIDLRIASLENLEISWNEAVDAVTQFGLLRINEIIGRWHHPLLLLLPPSKKNGRRRRPHWPLSRPR